MLQKRRLIPLERKIITGSITYAVRCKDVLVRNGYKALVIRNTNDIKTGCGYGVKTYGEMEKIEELLKSEGIKYTKIL